LIWKQHQANQRQKLTPGFTLLEVLVAALIGSIIISALLWMVVQLVGAEQRESSLVETEREMQLALDYMLTDLREAVYVYDGSCNNPTGTDPPTTTSCPAYAAYVMGDLTNDTNSIPVLAFWKSEAVDVTQLDSDVSGLTDTDMDGTPECEDFATTDATVAAECSTIRQQRNAYSLVVYIHETESSDTWSGESRIRRYELDKYTSTDGTNTITDPPRLISANLGQTFRWTDGFVDPSLTNIFANWPFDSSGANNCQSDPDDCGIRGVDLSAPTTGTTAPNGTGNSGPVLIDFVARPDRLYNNVDDTSSITATSTTDPDPATLCPTDYVHTPRVDDNDGTVGEEPVQSRNFYACVRQTTAPGQFQDVIIYLRGNPVGRSGFPNSDSNNLGSSYTLPLIETQITMRGVIDRTP
jgi:prepilin-type N-terminal cleavage/methylation domain-containing protein